MLRSVFQFNFSLQYMSPARLTFFLVENLLNKIQQALWQANS